MRYMKKITTLVLLATLVVQPSKNNISAAVKGINTFSLADKQQVEITYDNDGGYFVETLDDCETTLPKATSYSTTSTISKTKTVKYYNSSNALCWSYTLKASFRVKLGVSATYRSSSASGNLYKSTWSIASEKHSGSGNIASGTIRMTTKSTTIAKTITIKCDKNGNFS